MNRFRRFGMQRALSPEGRPVLAALEWKRWKSMLRQGAGRGRDPRVSGLYPGHPTRPLKGRFADSRHPEIFARQIHRVIEWREARERVRRS